MIYSRYENAENIYGTTSSLLIYLELSTDIVGLLIFLLSASRSFSRKSEEWKELINCFENLEKPEKTRELSLSNVFNQSNSTLILSSLIYCVVIYMELMLNNRKLIQNLQYYGFSLLVNYVELVQINIISKLFICIKHKFRDINEILMKTDTDIFNVERRVEKVEKLYLVMDGLIVLMNSLFGWILLAMFFHISLMVLLALTVPVIHNYLTKNTSTQSDTEIPFGIYSVLQVVVISIMVFCIDSATREPQNLIKFCMNLECNFPLRFEQNKKIQIAIEKLKALSPNFSAADFFQITRSTLLSMISVITTYFIVMVQLHMGN
ncbi:uncharacterized protein [Leptinotarsa decemlineata]|uniref:uncharacterized protein n=1 Tax=Leptinotarsa decemlineata TaxID=7539 RepID=UPI003D308BB6